MGITNPQELFPTHGIIIAFCEDFKGRTMDLTEFLSSTEKTILFDGAMGTELQKFGLEMGGHNSALHPAEVLAVHKSYVSCGVNVLITNTLTMNRIYIEAHKVPVDVREVNLAGARLAREAIGEGGYVVGDISSTSKMLVPFGDLKKEDAIAAFKEQASILAEGGVDGFIIETMFDLQEALCAVEGCKAVSGLPVFATISFSSIKNGGRTIMGNTAQDCAKALTEAGASVVGANCGDLTPHEFAEIVTLMKAVTGLPILIQPNAGLPQLIDGETVFNMTPEDFTAGMMECVEAGARLVGGCCGTSPAHIQALAKKLGR
jgi:5-methyltetrahydrofolate--homocysteine methyltransferase